MINFICNENMYLMYCLIFSKVAINSMNTIIFSFFLVCLVPLQAWGPSFNFSIWYVELAGNTRWEEVKQCIKLYNRVSNCIISGFGNSSQNYPPTSPLPCCSWALEVTVLSAVLEIVLRTCSQVGNSSQVCLVVHHHSVM